MADEALSLSRAGFTMALAFFVPLGIFWCVLVPTFAVCLCSLSSDSFSDSGGNAQATAQVLFRRDSFKVMGIRAGANSAQMVYFQVGWDWSNKKRIGDPVGQIIALQIIHPHLSISSTLERTQPKPASGIRLWGDVVKKAFDNGSSHVIPPRIASVGRSGVCALRGLSHFSAGVA